MSPALESNIWKYTVLLVTNKRVFIAILGVYYLTIPGVTTFWIGIFLLAGNGAKFIFDIPSSYLADKIGHKEAIILSRVSLILSNIVFLFASNIWWLIISSILLSIGFAFLSGVGNAFMHETLRGLGREREYRTVMGKASAIGFALPALMAALVPFFVSVSYKIPFFVALILDIIGFLAANALVRPSVEPDRVAKIRETSFAQVMRQGFALRFFRIALFSGVVSALLDGVDGFRAPYQLFLHVPVIWFGIFFGAGRVLASLMLAYSGKIHMIVGNVYSYQRAQIIVYGILLLLAGLVSNPWVVVVVFVLDNGLQYGMSQIDTGYLLDIIHVNKFKATLLSVSNQIENVLSMIVVVTIGASIQEFGYQYSFIMLAGVFFLLLVPMHAFITLNRPQTV